MGFSQELGASSKFLCDSDLSFLASRKFPEDKIFEDVVRIRGSLLGQCRTPSQIMHIAESDLEFLQTLYPDLTHPEALLSLNARRDRCLVAALASTISNKCDILETGTFSGFTSAFVLLGLGFSSGGLLYTIDLPTSKLVTQEHHIDYRDIGQIISRQKNRNRAVQVIEDAKSALPRLLIENKVDMFIHDSLHTVTHQMYEYVVSRALMPINSILVSDDILWNPAFVSYVKLFDLPFWVCDTNPNYGIAVNTSNPQEKNFDWGVLSTSDYIMRVIGV